MSDHEKAPLTDMYDTFRQERFSRVSSNDWYLQGPGETPRSAVQAGFLADDSSERPAIDYTKVGTLDYAALEQTYYSLLDQAERAGDDVFYEQVARKLAELYRHKEVARLVGASVIGERFVDHQHTLKDQMAAAEMGGDTKAYDTAAKKLNDLRVAKLALARNGSDVHDKAHSTERAELMNEELFGELEQHDFEVFLAPYVAKATRLAKTLPEARHFLEHVGHDWNQDPGDFDFAIKPETLALLKDDLFAIFPDLEQTLAPAEARQTGAEEAVEVCNKVVNILGMSEKGWTAVVAPERTSAETTPSKKLIEFAGKRAKFGSTTAMNETVVHEAIFHGYRAMNAEAQADPSLRSKMPGTDDFEESFATAGQQLISQKPRIAGGRYVIAFGLGKGMDRGGEPRNFRDAYEILYDTLAIDNALAGSETTESKMREKAYQESNRIRRGGALDARDLSYFLGCKRSYVWMNEIAKLPAVERQAKLRWVLSGLFDPTNPEQADKFPEVAVGEV